MVLAKFPGDEINECPACDSWIASGTGATARIDCSSRSTIVFYLLEVRGKPAGAEAPAAAPASPFDGAVPGIASAARTAGTLATGAAASTESPLPRLLQMISAIILLIITIALARRMGSIECRYAPPERFGSVAGDECDHLPAIVNSFKYRPVTERAAYLT